MLTFNKYGQLYYRVSNLIERTAKGISSNNLPPSLKTGQDYCGKTGNVHLFSTGLDIKQNTSI